MKVQLNLYLDLEKLASQITDDDLAELIALAVENNPNVFLQDLVSSAIYKLAQDPHTRQTKDWAQSDSETEVITTAKVIAKLKENLAKYQPNYVDKILNQPNSKVTKMQVEVNLNTNCLAHALAKNQDEFAESIANSIEDYGMYLPSLIKKVIFQLANTKDSNKQDTKSKAFEVATLLKIELAKAYPKPEKYEPNIYTPMEVIESLAK